MTEEETKNFVQQTINQSLSTCVGMPATEITASQIRSTVLRDMFQLVNSGIFKRMPFDVRANITGNNVEVEVFNPVTGEILYLTDLLSG